MRVAVGEIGGQADLFQRRNGPRPRLGPAEPGFKGRQRAADDAGQRHPRVKRAYRVLEHDLHLAPAAGASVGDPAHVLPLPQHLARRGFDQPQQRPAGWTCRSRTRPTRPRVRRPQA
jgi:hypothetical protein